tara:strand:- start:5 stop:346 length:342 start_codon:yes stop_codon:yes gene_type:complete
VFKNTFFICLFWFLRILQMYLAFTATRLQRLSVAVVAQAFHDHICLLQLEIFWKLNIGNRNVEKTKRFVAVSTIKMIVQILWVTVTAFGTNRIFGHSRTIFNAVDNFVFLKCF